MPRATRAVRGARTGCALFALVFAATAGGSRAHADSQAHVVVAPFSGRNNKQIRTDVEAIVAQSATLIPRERTAPVRGQLVKHDLDPQLVLSVAADVGADVIVSARVIRRANRFRLIVHVYSGVNGARFRKFTVLLGRRPRVTSVARKKLTKLLGFAIVDAPLRSVIGPESDGDRSDGDRSDEDRSDEDRSDEDRPDEDRPDEDRSDEDRSPASTTDSPPANSSGVPGPADTTAPQTTAPDANGARAGATSGTGQDPSAGLVARSSRGIDRGIDLSAGASFVGRRLSFQARADVDTPYQYRSLPVPAGYVSVALRPLAAFGIRGVLGSVGGSFTYEQVLDMSSNVDGVTVNIPTQHRRWSAGVQVRIPFTSARYGTSLTLAGNYGRREFILNRAILMEAALDIDIPDVSYQLVDAGARLYIPMGSRVSMAARGAYVHALDAGDIEQPDWYGTSATWGIDADFDLSIRLISRIAIRIGAEYTRLQFSFQGDGVYSDRNGDGQADVNGAVDEYFGAHVTTGLRF